ncbi:FAD-dependent oxidoreductase [Nesterenkonia halophila]
MDEDTACAIVGGGPAGIVTGLLLARAGVDVVVLEKHGDFLRDFRGDTIHPATLLLLDELGLMDRFAQIDWHRMETARVPAADGSLVTTGDFRRLSHPYPYVALAPQWDLLDLLAAAAAEEPSFRLIMDAEVTGLRRRRDASGSEQITGVRWRDADGGAHELSALLTIAADGRGSVVRREAGLSMIEHAVPMDAWWFRLDADDADSQEAAGHTLFPRTGGELPVIAIPRGTYFQSAMLIPKGADAALRARGVGWFREQVAAAFPEFAEAAAGLSLEDVHVLDVRLDRARQWWRRGLLAVGDAAHAMSPVGGVGINLAVQDGVAAARLLAAPLRDGTISDADVAAVQRRRQPPAATIQGLQRVLHRGLARLFEDGAQLRMPAAAAALLRRRPELTVGPAALIGIGPRPEHAPDWARRRDATETEEMEEDDHVTSG